MKTSRVVASHHSGSSLDQVFPPELELRVHVACRSYREWQGTEEAYSELQQQERQALSLGEATSTALSDLLLQFGARASMKRSALTRMTDTTPLPPSLTIPVAVGPESPARRESRGGGLPASPQSPKSPDEAVDMLVRAGMMSSHGSPYK